MEHRSRSSCAEIRPRGSLARRFSSSAATAASRDRDPLFSFPHGFSSSRGRVWRSTAPLGRCHTSETCGSISRQQQHALSEFERIEVDLLSVSPNRRSNSRAYQVGLAGNRPGTIPVGLFDDTEQALMFGHPVGAIDRASGCRFAISSDDPGSCCPRSVAHSPPFVHGEISAAIPRRFSEIAYPAEQF